MHIIPKLSRILEQPTIKLCYLLIYVTYLTSSRFSYPHDKLIEYSKIKLIYMQEEDSYLMTSLLLFFLLFLFRRQLTILVITAVSILAITGIIVGLVVGLREREYSVDNNTFLYLIKTKTKNFIDLLFHIRIRIS